MRERIAHALQGLSADQLETLNTTTDKHILGKRLTIATALVCLIGFVNEVFDGGDRSYRMATAILDSWLFFLAAYLGINVAQYGIKRGTDKDTKVAVETAKATAAPSQVVQAAGGTVVAAAPPSETTVTEGNGGATVVTSKPTTAERPAVPAKPTEEPEWAQGDPRGGIL